MTAHNPSPATLQWTDAQARPWQLEAGPDRLTLRGDGSQTVIERRAWDARIDYNEVGGGVVFRFDLDDGQVGFLVSREQADALLGHLAWSNRSAVAQAARLQTLDQRPQTWPTVTPWAMVALFSAVCALWPGLPLLGFAIGGLCAVAIVVALRQARSNPRLVHVPTIAAAATALLAVALAANILAMVTAPGVGAGGPVISANPAEAVSFASKLLAVLIVLLSLTVHESAHAVTAWWCGDEGPRRAGRITLNPLPHIDPLGTVLVPAFLAMTTSTIFGWAKPVMVTLHGVPNPRRANLLISAAGPASNLLLGLFFLAAYFILGCTLRLAAPQAEVVNFSYPLADVHISGVAGAEFLGLLAVCLRWGFLINLLLCCFNLIPIPPLDGGHVLSSLFPGTVGQLYRRLGPYALLIFLVLISSGIIGSLLAPMWRFVFFVFGTVHDVTGY